MFVAEIIITFGSLLLFLKRFQRINRTFAFFLLFILWSFSYLYSPYWYAFGTFGFPALRYVAFIFLLLFGLVWAYLSASDLRMPKVKLYPIPLFLLGIFLYAVNFRQLSADIPWRGDEDFHVLVLLRLKEYFSFFIKNIDLYLFQSPVFWIWLLLLFFVLFFHRFFMKRIRHSGKEVPGGTSASRISIVQRDSGQARMTAQSRMNYTFVASGLLLIILPAFILFSERSFTDQKNIFLLSDLLRYPFIQKWVNFFFIVPNFYEISLYRIVPFLSLVGIAFFLFYNFKQQLGSTLLSFLFAFAFSTVPLLLFYSSILYLEMPVVFLILVSIWNIQILIKEGANKLKRHYVWYALVLLSFFEESALVFLLLILALRIIYQILIQYKARGVIKPLFSEGKLSVLILGPIVTYILFRIIFLSYYWSSFSFYLSNIFSVANYIETMRSLIFQTGALPAVAVLGLVVLSKKDVFTTRAIALVFAGILVFFLGYLHRVYVGLQGETLLVGYSRYPNLYLLPMIFFAAIVFVNYIVSKRREYGIILLFATLALNIILFPFKSDGARLPNWGVPNMDIAEYAYPYNEAIRFLSTQKQTNNLLLLGQYSPYWGLRFYLEKYNFHPQAVEHYFGAARFDKKKERQMFDLFFDKPPFSADTILYHSVNNIDLNTNNVYGGRYKIVKRVQNSLHSLYILHAL